jgi:hypothetical protein
MFSRPGDAQASQFILRQVTEDDRPSSLTVPEHSLIKIAANESAAYKIVVVARGKENVVQAAFEAGGLVSRGETGDPVLSGNQVKAIYRSDPGLAIQVRTAAATEALDIQVQGLPNQAIRWVGHVELTEVRF